MTARPFAFGSCRIRTLPCPQCVTLIHSAAQLLWWLDVIEGLRPIPPLEWRRWICRDWAEHETWRHDLTTPTCFIIEISSFKTPWCGPYPLQLSEPWTEAAYQGDPATLIIASQGKLMEELEEIRTRLGRPLILLGQVCARDDIVPRLVIRDVLRNFVATHADCQHFDPTTLIVQHGEAFCLKDQYHWTEAGATLWRNAIMELVV